MPYIASPSAETVTFPDKISCFQLQVRVSRWASSKKASLARRASRHVCAPQGRYLFRTTSRLSPIGRAEDYRERETSEILRRTGGSGPPPRTALQNSKLPGMFPGLVAGRLDESQPAIPSPKLALQIDPCSPASAD